jgi:hypothetical protein
VFADGVVGDIDATIVERFDAIFRTVVSHIVLGRIAAAAMRSTPPRMSIAIPH